VADACFDDLDAGLLQPVVDLLAQPVSDLTDGKAQRNALIIMGIIGIAGRQDPHRSLALYVNEVLIVVHIENGLKGLNDPPHHDRGDLDRIAVAIVHLEFAALEIAHPQRQLAPGGQGVNPPEPGRLDRALVDAEQGDHTRFVRVHDGKAGKADGVDHQDGDQHRYPERVFAADRAEDSDDGGHQDRDEHHHHQPSRKPTNLCLTCHWNLLLANDIEVISL
jgi:hypothetical protein